jgi:phosphoglycolate phosphatase
MGDGAGVTHLICFDVDGTLLASVAGSNRAHRDSFGAAIAAVHGVAARIDDIEHSGMTDMWIARELLDRKGVPAEAIDAHMPALTAAMVEYVAARREELAVSVLPGVRALLQALHRRRDVRLALVTGNLEPIARMKLAACGLDGFFQVGGFGSDHVDRAELVRLAVARAAAAHPGLDPARLTVVHCGDTMHDLRAAVRAGARGLGVATGGYSADTLRRGLAAELEAVAAEAPAVPALDAGRYHVRDDLRDTAAVLAVLGLAPAPAEEQDAAGDATRTVLPPPVLTV